MLKNIETPRLIIRKPQLGDENELNLAVNRSLKELERWMPWANDASLKATTDFICKGIQQWNSANQTDFPMIVIHKEDRKIIGGSGFNEKSNPEVPFFEIGYWLDSQYTGQGLATELTAALTRYAFEVMHAKRVQICLQAGNSKSQRVAEKCGFMLEACLRYFRVDCLTKKPVDDLIYVCFDAKRLPFYKVSW